jgi:hypothetical protein
MIEQDFNLVRSEASAIDLTYIFLYRFNPGTENFVRNTVQHQKLFDGVGFYFYGFGFHSVTHKYQALVSVQLLFLVAV